MREEERVDVEMPPSSSAHLAIAANSRRHQYGDITPNMRLVIIAISTRVAPSTARASTSSRTSPSAPKIPFHFVALLDQASWAAPRLAPMIRMALGFAVRRGLAAAVYHWWRRSHAFVQRPPAPPSPTIVLLPPADA